MDQLLRLSAPQQQLSPATADEDSHQSHPLVTFGRGGDKEEKPTPRIKPSQIYQNYNKKAKPSKHAASKGFA